MLGSIFLPYHIRRYRKRKIQRFTRSFDAADTIGLICSYKTLINGHHVDDLIDKLKKRDKTVNILVFYDNSSNTSSGSTGSFSKKDLTFFGFWSKGPVKTFVSKKFDFLINLDLVSNNFVDSVLAESKALCRVGPFTSGSGSFLELMVKPEKNDPVQYIDDTLKLLSEIRNYE
ncbi:MAG: hypothetical protein O2887_05880 [Bacteroidetes bacterium]|nr:hypothetical protein [Bacteroidota bacterium]MDA1120011.1 hypothetical protein [Bacteroidota bacterium]